MAPKQTYRGGARGRGGQSRYGNGISSSNSGGGKEFERPPETHAERAADLLARARAAVKESPSTGAGHHALNTTSPSPSPSLSSSTKATATTIDTSNAPIALPVVLKSLVNPALGAQAFRVKDAIPLAGKLVRAKLNTPVRLAHLNGPVLEDAGITGQHDKDRILMAFGVRALREGGSESGGGGSILKRALTGGASSTASPSSSSSSLAAQQQSKRRKRAMDDEALSREYGNVTAPDDSAAERGLGGEQIEYLFHEVLEEEALRGRFALVNRAPIMTAWSTIVLERLGFQRREALSLAHCYVNTTSTARGISLGIIPASERERAVHAIGSNQPHFSLMGVKIPLMKLSQTDEWRGISKGQVVGPDQAFNYMRKSMFQTLPLVIGALTLLADSYVNDREEVEVKEERSAAHGDAAGLASGPDVLHARAYDLYTQFRPATAGEWGKKSMFYCAKALALRRGHEADLARWEQGSTAGSADQGDEEQEAKVFEEELRALVEAQGVDEEPQSIDAGEDNIRNVPRESIKAEID